MARIVSEFQRRPRTGSKATKYPYEEWMDGRPRILDRGIDFDHNARISSVRVTISTGMKKRGFHLTTSILSNDEISIRCVLKGSNRANGS